MKDCGTIRKIDELGRIVIPADMRRTFHWQTSDSIKISVNQRKQTINLKKVTCILPKVKIKT